VTATLRKNVMTCDGESDAPFVGEVLLDGNRIKSVAHRVNEITRGCAAARSNGGDKNLMPGPREGQRHLSFVEPAHHQDRGQIPPKERLLRACRNGRSVLNHGVSP
jgi:hypothetical protein